MAVSLRDPDAPLFDPTARLLRLIFKRSVRRAADVLELAPEPNHAAQPSVPAANETIAASSDCDVPCTDASAPQASLLFGAEPSGCPVDDIWVTTVGELPAGQRGQQRLELMGSIDRFSEALFLLEDDVVVVAGAVKRTSPSNAQAGSEFRSLEPTDDCQPAQSQLTERLGADGLNVPSTGLLVPSDPTGCLVAGRRPEGLCSEEATGKSVLARFFARFAHLEAASVKAFAVLEEELEALGAAESLLRTVRAARADEVDHARRVGMLATRFGGSQLKVNVAERPLRDRLALALDNASEGCVREAYGALLATYQSEQAEDLEIRRTMTRIAEDETRHAALAFKLDAWLCADLSSDQVAQVKHAQRSALAQLQRELAQAQPDELVRMAGMPSPRAALSLLADLERTLLDPAQGIALQGAA